MTTLHDFTVKTIEGKEQSLADYRGKARLVVNVASKCGLTPARFEPKTAPAAPEVRQAIDQALGA